MRGAYLDFLPTQIFLSALVAWYLFRDPYLSYSGSDVTGCENAADPGTLDLTALGTPQMSASALDGQDCVVFDGVNEMLRNLSYTILDGDAPDVYMVAQALTVPPASSKFFFSLEDVSGNYQTGIYHGSDTTVRMWSRMDPGASAKVETNIDTATGNPRLVGVSTYQQGSGTADATGWTDGVAYVSQSGYDGIAADAPSFAVGCRPLSTSYALNCRISECVVVNNDPNGDANRLAYQNRIASIYPTIAAALP